MVRHSQWRWRSPISPMMTCLPDSTPLPIAGGRFLCFTQAASLACGFQSAIENRLAHVAGQEILQARGGDIHHHGVLAEWSLQAAGDSGKHAARRP